MSRIARRVRQEGVYFITSQTWQRRTLFSKPEAARILLERMLDCREKGFYKLHAFVIMPDHIHGLLTPSESTTIEKAMQMIKGGSAHRIRREFPSRYPVWQNGFHDRWVRDEVEYRRLKNYIDRNPVEDRLAERPCDYFLGSACRRYPLDPSRFDGQAARG